jgi:ligand-binding sensor domain-containing protein/signal transduction histidine kinase
VRGARLAHKCDFNANWNAICLYLLVFLLVSPLAAVTNLDSFWQLSSLEKKIECISPRQGLSQIVVQDILQDARGFLWFCTVDGLKRYDGYTFTIYRNEAHNANSLSHDFLQTICEDSTGNLWIGTFQGGLNRFDPDRKQFTRYRHNPLDQSSLSSDIVNSICQDRYGVLWFGTENGLDRYNPTTRSFDHFRHNPQDGNSLSHNSVQCLCEDRDGHLWIGTNGGGVNHFDPRSGQWHCYRHDPQNPFSLGYAHIRKLHFGKSGILWIGTDGGGLDRLDDPESSVPRFRHYRHNPGNASGLSHNSIYALLEDEQGFLWIGANGGGVSILEPHSDAILHFHHVDNDQNTLSSDEVYSICKDRSGIIWIGTYTGGINKVNRNKIQFTHVRVDQNRPGLNNNFIWGLYEDQNRILWIGTKGGGLNAFDRQNNTWRYFRHNPGDPHSLSEDKVRNILCDRQGQFWVTTESNGFNKFDSQTGYCRRFVHDPQNPNSLNNNGIRAIFEDDQGILWISTFGGGLDRFDGRTERFVHYATDAENPRSISCNYVRTIVQDQTGTFWIGTEGGGLNEFDRKTGLFKHYRARPENPRGLSNDYIFAMHLDQQDILWIGTWGGGLNRFDIHKGVFQCYTVENGLADNVIYGIVEDAYHDLWLSTNKGISRFNPGTESFINYTIEDGLQSLEFNAGSCHQNRDGEIFFGGIAGFNIFYPEKITHNTKPPTVAITSFSVFNQEANLGHAIENIDQIDLSYQDNFFAFEFAALDFQAPLKNRYAYKMDGLDRDWIYTDADKRYASYTSLSPGAYLFRVKASNNDGLWNERGASIRVTIHPPFWLTWWFISGSVGIIACLAAAAILLRVRYLLAIERVRIHIAADLHDTIGAGLTEIAILGELAQKKSDESKINMRKIIDIARSLVDSMNDLIWMIHPHRDSLHDLVVKIKDTNHDMFLAKGILFAFDNRVEGSVHLPMEYRRQLFLMLKEATHNCVKHSNCTDVSLLIEMHKKKLKLLLTDNGQGMDEDDCRKGNGLQNMQRRAHSLGGELFIQSQKGAGTTITFIGKIPRRKLTQLFSRRIENSLRQDVYIQPQDV